MTSVVQPALVFMDLKSIFAVQGFPRCHARVTTQQQALTTCPHNLHHGSQTKKCAVSREGVLGGTLSPYQNVEETSQLPECFIMHHSISLQCIQKCFGRTSPNSKGTNGKLIILVVSLHIQWCLEISAQFLSHHPNANPNYKSCTSFWTSLSQQA